MANNNITENLQKGDGFGSTDSEIELLLECVKVYSSKCCFNWTDWEGVKAKYDKERAIFVYRYPQDEESDDEFPKADNLLAFTKERIVAKLKAIRKLYKKAVDLGR